MSNIIVRRCCKKPPKFIIVYNTKKPKTFDAIVVCQKDSEHLAFRTSVKWIFDFKTRKELTPEEAFNEG